MDSSKTNSVAVVAAANNDRQLMQSLLENAGYSPGVFPCAASFEDSGACPAAMIVCHRRASTGLLSNLPKRNGHQRVVVFSDCMAEQTIVGTLEAGAHHFFDINESQNLMQARLEAALRQNALQKQRELHIDPFKFNLERRVVTLDGQLVNLSPKEYEFAYYLFSNRHRVVVNSELMTSVWSLPSTMDARRIDTAACRVRKKMQLSEASTGWCLRRLRRVGYELQWRGEQLTTTDARMVEPARPCDAVLAVANDKINTTTTTSRKNIRKPAASAKAKRHNEERFTLPSVEIA